MPYHFVYPRLARCLCYACILLLPHAWSPAFVKHVSCCWSKLVSAFVKPLTSWLPKLDSLPVLSPYHFASQTHVTCCQPLHSTWYPNTRGILTELLSQGVPIVTIMATTGTARIGPAHCRGTITSQSGVFPPCYTSYSCHVVHHEVVVVLPGTEELDTNAYRRGKMVKNSTCETESSHLVPVWY